MEAAMLIAKKASDLGFTHRQIKVGVGVGRTQRRDDRAMALAMIAIADWRPLSLPRRRRGKPSKAQAARGQQARSAKDAAGMSSALR
jgi:hypothetical protein